MKYKFKSAILNYLQDRGYIYQIIDPIALDELLLDNKTSIYAGFDLTAKSLHIGSLIPIMMLKTFQEFGYKPIILLGGATTKIGDPSGKDKSRQLLTDEVIEQNLNGIKKVFNKFLDFSNPKLTPVIVNNEEWLANEKYLDFLRNIGRHFSINQMLGYESVKQRLDREQNLNFIEFNYMILQAYDFVKLNQDHNCRLQIGGSDQWGNIVNGVELNRKMNGLTKPVYGLTTPLLLNSEGKKMGKTESGAIWLDEELFSPYDYYQFFRNIDDKKTIEFLKLFTNLDITEIAKLALLSGQDINNAKEILAYEATKLCHGEVSAKQAKNTADNLFKNNQSDDNLPTIYLAKSDFDNNMAFSALIAKTNIVASRGEAKRIILGGGGKINDVAYKDPLKVINISDFDDNHSLKISAGKKKHAIVKIVQ
jgi:tyrosyl-tRNA synthetase